MFDSRRRPFNLGLLVPVLALVLGACATTEPQGPEDDTEITAEPRIMGAAALYGTWADGRVHSLTLDEDATFLWNRPRRCSEPPCPVQRLAGVWRVEDDTLVVDPATEESQRYSYELSQNPRMLVLTSADGEEVWRFGYARSL
ncbi:MAG: hypothetical protein ACQEXJ_05185 [Myxococcota bacterium]